MTRLDNNSIYNLLINLSGIGFILIGLSHIIFYSWIQQNLHYVGDDKLSHYTFYVLELGIGLLLLIRWKISPLAGEFSRIAVLFYSGSYILALFLLPFGDSFQYAAVKILWVFYLCFYIGVFGLMLLKSAKKYFPEVPLKVTQPVSNSRHEKHKYPQEILSREHQENIKDRVEIIGWVLFIDGIIHSILWLIFAENRAVGFIHPFGIMEILIGLAFIKSVNWVKSWALLFLAFWFLGCAFVPTLLFFTVKNIFPQYPVFIEYIQRQGLALIVFNGIYAVFFLYTIEVISKWYPQED